MEILNSIFNLILAAVGGGSLILVFLNAIVPALIGFLLFIILDMVKSYYSPKDVHG